MATSITSLHDAIAPQLGRRCRTGESLARRSSWRVGGEAALWVEPHDRAELLLVLEQAQACGVEILPVGLGSNALYPDEGLDACLLRLGGDLASTSVLADSGGGTVHMEVGAGIPNAHLVRSALDAGLVGAEFLLLIPGTFGGAVALNAGTKEQEVASILTEVELAIPRDGAWALERVPAADLDMRYRHCDLPAGAVVLSGTLALARGDVDAAHERAQYDKDRRNRTQPYKLASVGSTFANPPEDYAGRLIDAAGLKGARIGGAEISALHANFFINTGEATAADFVELMALARHRVREQFGVTLRPEVRFVGFDGFAQMMRIEQRLAAQDAASRENGGGRHV